MAITANKPNSVSESTVYRDYGRPDRSSAEGVKPTNAERGFSCSCRVWCHAGKVEFPAPWTNTCDDQPRDHTDYRRRAANPPAVTHDARGAEPPSRRSGNSRRGPVPDA